VDIDFCALSAALLLNTVMPLVQPTDFDNEIFMRVERTVCCGLCSTDPATRQKFFRLHTDRIPRELFDRLRFIIQYQDWEFLAHTFWLKHAVVSCKKTTRRQAASKVDAHHTSFHLFAGNLIRLPAHA